VQGLISHERILAVHYMYLDSKPQPGNRGKTNRENHNSGDLWIYFRGKVPLGVACLLPNEEHYHRRACVIAI
jgi:hypothetical protein